MRIFGWKRVRVLLCGNGGDGEVAFSGGQPFLGSRLSGEEGGLITRKHPPGSSRRTFINV